MKLLERFFRRKDDELETHEEVSEEDEGEVTGEYKVAQRRLADAFEKGDEYRERLRTSTQTMRAVGSDAA